ncbi:MAG: ribonuclease H-like domain-containing protein [Eubacterium sp.]|nr:ribonuclease H-like domain-containing protein [Eubacterium sp.]
MITRTYSIINKKERSTEDNLLHAACPLAHPSGKLAWLGEKDPLFLDIETTGLSSGSSHLYQITICYHRKIHQWFLDHPWQEKEMLQAFYDFLIEELEPDACLVTYNGTTFDLPYLERKAAFYGVALPFSKMRQIDLYALLRPYRKLISPDSFKQKDLEHYAGIFRKDPYSGGELIRVYEKYLASFSDELLNELLLHNLEDVTGMIEILPVLIWKKLFDGNFKFSLESAILSEETEEPGRHDQAPSVTFSFSVPESNFYLPESLFKKICIAGNPYIRLFPASSGCYKLYLTVKGVYADLKHFLPDNKNYYYLTEEDSIIPKSLAYSVDPRYRRKASKSDCFVRQTGSFLPQTRKMFLPEFQTAYKAQPLYYKADQLLKADQDVMQDYILSLLAACLS